MDLKTTVVDTLDPRPLKKVTAYAFGTALEGVAVGLGLTVLFPELNAMTRGGVAAFCFACGAILAVSSYSALKRNYKIVEKGAEPPAMGSNG